MMITIKINEKFELASDRIGTQILVNLDNKRELYVALQSPFKAYELAAAFRVLAGKLENA